jgi:hypothetical protein
VNRDFLRWVQWTMVLTMEGRGVLLEDEFMGEEADFVITYWSHK